MKNKKGAQNAMIWVVVVLVVGFLLYQQGFFAPSVPEIPKPDGLAPSDLQTTFDMSFKDELATTETSVDAKWYAFRASDGSYINTGNASSGTSSLTTNYGEDYDIWAYKLGYAGYIAKKTRVSATAAKIPVTITLIKRGGLDVVGMDDPVDLDTNLTGTAGATEEFRTKWKVNVSNSGSLDPLIYFETNDTATGIEDLTITKADSAGGTYTEVTCPDRLTQNSTKEVFYCFQRDRIAYASDGIIITYATVLIDSTTAPGANDIIRARLGDTGMYLKPGFTDISGVKFGFEDDSNTIVGAPSDSMLGSETRVDFAD